MLEQLSSRQHLW